MLALHKNKGAALVETGAKVKFMGAETFGWVHVVAGDQFPNGSRRKCCKTCLKHIFPHQHSLHI